MERLEGRYEYVRELGRGGVGRVVLARDLEEGATRALKIVPHEALGALELELATLRTVIHPSLARVHELLRVSAPLGEPFRLPVGTAVLVQEHVDGDRSDRVFAALEPGSRERLRLAMRVASEVLAALAALHAAGIAHGDVSPANVLLRREGTPLAVLIDLGLAGPPLGPDGLARGTRGFLAPEAALGVRSQSTDAYALGATMHAWLGGAPTERIEPNALPGSIPRALIGWIEDLTAERPEDRPSTAADALEGLATIARAWGEPLPELSAPRRVIEPAFVGDVGQVARAARSLIEHGVLGVGGPPESGKSRFAREVALEVQAIARREGRRVPTFVRPSSMAELEGIEASCAIVHVEGALGETWRAVRRAEQLAGNERSWIVEDAPEPDVVLGPLRDADFERLARSVLSLVGDAAADSEAREALDALRTQSGGLAGRAVRLASRPSDAKVARSDDVLSDAVLSDAVLSDAGDISADDALSDDEERLDVAGGELPVHALRDARSLVRRGHAFLREDRVVLRIDRRGRVDPSRKSMRAAEVRGLCRVRGVWDAHLAHASGEEETARALFAEHARRALEEGRPEEALAAARRSDPSTAADVGSRALGRLARYAEAFELAEEPTWRAELARRAGRTEVARVEASKAGEAGADTLGWIALGEGKLDEAARRARSPELLAWIATSSGRAEEAERALAPKLARSQPRTSEGREERARCLLAFGAAAHARGAPTEARARHAEAFAIARGLGDVHLAATAAANEGIAALDAGELGRGRRALREAVRRYARIGRARDLGRALLNLANAALWVGEDEGAAWYSARAREAATEADDGLGLAYVASVELELALRRGALDAATEQARVLDERGDARVRARAAAWLAEARPALAQALLSRAAEAPAFDRGHASARVALARGDVAAARERRATLEAHTWEEELLLARLDHELDGSRGEAPELALGRLRALLDRVSRGLDPDQRRHLRRHPAFTAAWSARPSSTPSSSSSAEELERWRELTSFAARAMSADEAWLVEEMLGRAREVLDAERAFVVARAEDGTLVVRGRSGEANGEARPSRSVVARALASGALVTTVDALGDEEWGRSQSVHALALRSVACAPLPNVALALYVDDRVRPAAFGAVDLAYLEALARTADAAIAQARARVEARRASEREAELRASIEARLARADEELRARRSDDERLGLVAQSPAMRRFVELVERVAPSEAAVLLRGETGSGKERVARAIHDASARAAGPFVAESCAALPDALLESALFGHVRGAFTGATDRRRGLFELAHGGTLLLDEVAETSPAMQAKLLRALQEGEVRPLGAERTVRVDVRVIAATHRDLRARVREGAFREDLFYRLAVIELTVPPLRERAEDLPGLVRSLLARRGATVRVPASTFVWLSRRAWPGNVRELESALERALLAARDELRPEHFALTDHDEAPELRDAVDDLERKLVVDALEATGGNRTHAAARLGLSRVGLRKKMKRLGIA